MREHFVARPFCYFTPFLHFGKCLPGSGAVSYAVLRQEDSVKDSKLKGKTAGDSLHGEGKSKN